jgi:hypothetical protein
MEATLRIQIKSKRAECWGAWPTDPESRAISLYQWAD